jgi:hypothetical protein
MSMDAWAVTNIIYAADDFLRKMFSTSKATDAFLEFQKESLLQQQNNLAEQEPDSKSIHWREENIEKVKAFLAEHDGSKGTIIGGVLKLLNDDPDEFEELLQKFFPKCFPELPELLNIGYRDERWRKSEGALPVEEYYLEFESGGIFESVLTQAGEAAGILLSEFGIDEMNETTYVIISS